MITLGLSDIRLEYMAEGAANVIYRISPPNMDPNTAADLDLERLGDSPLPTEIEPLQMDPRLYGKLIRLKKDLPNLAPVVDSQKHFENEIKPLFRDENLLEAILFQISRDLLQDCNSILKQLEKNGSRPAKRHGVYLAEDEKHGCLITDMSNPDTSPFKCFEFKPKWLVQSPSAPADSRRCRTCALRAMKRGTKSESSDISKAVFCPLNLVSSDKAQLADFVDYVLRLDPQRDRSKANSTANTEHKVLMNFLYKNPLLDNLKDLQMRLDPDGVFKADLMSPRFLAAMTLRDCSLFLKVSTPSVNALIWVDCSKVPTDRNSKIEARLGDLDLKTSSGKKAEYWRSLERRLIDEGWYRATEKAEIAQENLCQLSLETL